MSIKAAEVEIFVSRASRKVMLDLILYWARIDTAISLLASAIFDLSPIEGAILMERTSVADRLRKISKALEQRGEKDKSSEIRRLKKEYELHVEPRNTIAHSTMVGTLIADRNRVVFQSFATTVLPGQLEIIAVHVDRMRRSTLWAIEAEQRITKMLAQTSFFAQHMSISGSD